jgi:hypothetical protein
MNVLVNQAAAGLTVALPPSRLRPTWLPAASFIVVLLIVGGGGRLQAGAIPIDLGKTGLSFDRAVSFNNLNGTSLLGQTLSLDFSFTKSEFARLFTVTMGFDATLTLQTSGGPVGFIDGTGYLFDAVGKAIHTPQILGSASSSSGDLIVGLLPPSDLPRPSDFFGVHFDLTFPVNPSVEVTGGQFRLATDSGPFGIGPGIPADIVPEIGGTLLLLGIGLAALIGMKIKTPSVA